MRRFPRSSSPGTVYPATEKWIASALDDAADDGAPLAIIRLDTPGGLDSSMREIVKDIIDAPMPVVVYVSPDGARAGSAGAFITEAADVAAMAPETNIGSAAPITSDRRGHRARPSAARSRTTPPPSSGRWPRATAATPSSPSGWSREATNVTAAEALEAGADRPGRRGRRGPARAARRLRRPGPEGAGARHRRARGRGARHAASVRDPAAARQPELAFLLILLGLVGIAIEVFSPGAIFPERSAPSPSCSAPTGPRSFR